MTMKERFPALRQFFACYLHEDWMLEVENWQGVVLGYLKTEPPDLVRSATNQLGQFLAMDLKGEHLEEALDELGNCYSPRPEKSYEAWLHELFRFLRDHPPG